MEKKSGKLNNMQRKALVDIIENKKKQDVKDIKNINGIIQNYAEEKIKKKLGYEIIVSKINSLEKEAEQLRDKLENLGFTMPGPYNKKSQLITKWDPTTAECLPVNSDAFKLIKKEIRFSVKDINGKYDNAKEKLWMAETKDEARTIIKTLKDYVSNFISEAENRVLKIEPK